MTITADVLFDYDTSGRIIKENPTVFGFPGDPTFRTYNGYGKLETIDRASSSSENDEFYEYDGSARLIRRYVKGQTGTAVDDMTFTLDTNGRIERIDETQYGTPSSYRLITRDGSGNITREDIYPPGGGVALGYIEHVNNDTLKTKTITCYLGGMAGFILEVQYDNSGIISRYKAALTIGGLYSVDTVYVLQDGIFNPAGMNGYYYTDKDTFGLIWIQAAASGFGF